MSCVQQVHPCHVYVQQLHVLRHQMHPLSCVGVGETSFFKTRRDDREMGNETEFEIRNGREMRRNSRQEMGVNRKRDEKHHFSRTNKKNREKNRKLQEIQKQDFDEISEIAENGNKISTRFWEMLKTESRTKTRSSQMSQYDDARAKTRSRCRPSTVYSRYTNCHMNSKNARIHVYSMVSHMYSHTDMDQLMLEQYG